MEATNNKNKTTIKLPVFLISIILAIAIGYIGNCNKKVATKVDQSNFINSLYDTIRTLRKDSALSTTKISSLQMASAKQFIDLKISNEEISKLQNIVKSYSNKLKVGSSVTNTTVDTHIDKTTPNIFDSTIGNIDSNLVIHSTDTTHIYFNTNPYFESRYKDKWIDYDVKTYTDSTKLKIDITNEYSVILGYDKKIPFADVINYNPYSTVTKLRTFQVSVPKQKNWGIGFNTGIGFSYDLVPRPYIGVGISYNVIHF